MTDPNPPSDLRLPGFTEAMGPVARGKGFHADTHDDPTVAQMVFILDHHDSAPSIERLRRWALDLAQPAAGDVVVDVGCGTGTMTRRLAGLVGAGGRAIGVDPNPKLLEVARDRAGEESAAEFAPGLAGALPFEDGSVDLVWCERVLQHVEDAAAALNDIARVLRPGGRAVLLDSDHSTRIIAGIDPEVEGALNAYFLTQSPNPRAARYLPEQILAAGLVLEPDVGSSALVFPLDGATLLPFVAMMGPGAVDAGFVAAERFEQAVQVLRAAAASGCAFSAVTVFGFVARRPAG